MSINLYNETSIDFNYTKITKEFIAELKQQQNIVEITANSQMIVHNAYYQRNLQGTFSKVFTRQAVLHRLNKINSILAPDYGLFIFDAFRTKETQAYLFAAYKQDIYKKKPYLKPEQLEVEVRKYVSHPNEPARFVIPPHNSGGAIDLAIYDRRTNEVLDFGCSFDETEEIARTDYFEQEYNLSITDFSEEQWYLVRKNRRLLFNLMKEHGFTNYRTEWWHYDLGDCMWAIEHDTAYIFDSMEQAVKEKMRVSNAYN